MKVQELIEQLKRFPEDAEVVSVYNYGDYWKTEVAAPVNTLDLLPVKWSEYHGMNKVVDYDKMEDDVEYKHVVALG